MGLSDDIDGVDPRSEEQAAAEASVAAVEEAVQASDVEGALAAVGELLGDLWELDDEGFDEVENPPLAKPTVYLPSKYGPIGVAQDDFDEGGRINLMSTTGRVSVWVNIPGEEESYNKGSAGFYLDPETALWLGEVLPEFAAAAEADEPWEFTAP